MTFIKSLVKTATTLNTGASAVMSVVQAHRLIGQVIPVLGTFTAATVSLVANNWRPIAGGVFALAGVVTFINQTAFGRPVKEAVKKMSRPKVEVVEEDIDEDVILYPVDEGQLSLHDVLLGRYAPARRR